jgi:hypothetical protein
MVLMATFHPCQAASIIERGGDRGLISRRPGCLKILFSGQPILDDAELYRLRCSHFIEREQPLGPETKESSQARIPAGLNIEISDQ